MNLKAVARRCSTKTFFRKISPNPQKQGLCSSMSTWSWVFWTAIVFLVLSLYRFCVWLYFYCWHKHKKILLLNSIHFQHCVLDEWNYAQHIYIWMWPHLFRRPLVWFLNWFFSLLCWSSNCLVVVYYNIYSLMLLSACFDSLNFKFQPAATCSKKATEHQINLRNLSKVFDIVLISFLLRLNSFTQSSVVSIIDYKRVIASWVALLCFFFVFLLCFFSVLFFFWASWISWLIFAWRQVLKFPCF